MSKPAKPSATSSATGPEPSAADPADSFLIWADQREAGSDVAEELARIPQVRLKFTGLEVGDYLVAADLVVERKSAADLTSSIVDGRLFRQVAEMKHHYGRVVLLIQGGELYRRLKPAAVRGALAYLAAVENISVLRSTDGEDTAGLIYALARLADSLPLDRSMSLPKRRAAGLAAQQSRVVQSLPGIGPVLARAMLDRFGTLEAIFQADEPALRQVPGVGLVLARRLRGLASAPFAESEQPQDGRQEDQQSNQD